ncbi:hypothetical protein [Inquilinus sp. CAU 1745]|uniref:hypothetical protein n=1 Tax=Inquilinus sp. CAU 1745 TaxID=3140369 RepID=UPI00325AF297
MSRVVIAALVDRRQNILREMSFMREEISRCEKALEHLDASIRLIDPTFDFSALKPPRRTTPDEVFRPGETPLLALDILREAPKPMSTTDIARRMLEGRGSPRVSPRQFETLNRKVNAVLNTKFRQGVVRKTGRVQGANRAVLWEAISS